MEKYASAIKKSLASWHRVISSCKPQSSSQLHPAAGVPDPVAAMAAVAAIETMKVAVTPHLHHLAMAAAVLEVQ